jgi:ferrous iron transport protein A
MRRNRPHSQQVDSLTLDELSPGNSAVIISLTGGRQCRQKLFDLGFVPGQKVKVMRKEKTGPLLVSHGGRSTAIGRGLAEKVVVSDSGGRGARRHGWRRRGG